MLYMVIGWYILGGIVSGSVIRKKIKKNEQEMEWFMDDCNEILAVIKRFGDPEYLTICEYCNWHSVNLDKALKFLIDQDIIYCKHDPEDRYYHRYYMKNRG